jgi:hypothetical protein
VILAAGLATGLSALPVLGGTVVTDALVEAVARIESNGGRQTVGDNGKARGWWQMHEPAWQDTTAFRAGKGLPTWDYEHAHDREIARLYARDYLTMMESRLRAVTKEEPTVEMVYAAYNVGFGRFQALDFKVENTRASTRASCARLQSLMAEAHKPPERPGSD